MNYLSDDALEHVFDFLSHRDRNAVSLVCKSWYRLDRFSREKVLIRNCYAVNPERMIARFPHLRSLTLKARPNFTDLPHNWGGYVYPWIEAMANSKINLEELRLKRMVVSDTGLELLAKSFPNLKCLVLVFCKGFSTDGLAAIASNCRFVRELDLHQNEVGYRNGDWLSCFPESFTSLVTLNFACLRGEDVNLAALESLVARCPNLTTLELSYMPMEVVHNILVQAPQLTHLGSVNFSPERVSETYIKLVETMENYQSIKSFSGFLGVSAMYPICSNLTYLNLVSVTGMSSFEFRELISHCKRIEKLWVLDSIRDRGLVAVASSCKELRELRVFHPKGEISCVTGVGLVAISTGCPKLESIVFYCRQISNAALISVAEHCPKLIRFKLISTFPSPFKQELDEGYGAIVRFCRGLKRLSVSGLLTYKIFNYIAVYGVELEMISVAFAEVRGNCLLHMLKGCKKLKKLEMRECRFVNMGIVSEMGKYKSIRSFLMWNCELTFGICKSLAEKMRVEIITKSEDLVKNMYLYRTLVGPRKEASRSVMIL